MTVVEKPATLTFVEADVAAAYQGAAFWDHLLLAIPFDEGTGSPQAWVQGVGKIATTTTGGGSGPTWSDDANLGTVLTYVRDSLDRTSIANANLPANFPGKANTPFTVLFYGTIADVGVANNILTKQSNTDDPYLLSVTSAGKVSAGISTVNYVGTTTLVANTPYLIGTVWDGANVHLLVDGTREGTTARTAALPTNTGDMRFATRQDLGNCWGGKAGILYVLDAAVAESVTQALASDPYGPVTADAGGGSNTAPATPTCTVADQTHSSVDLTSSAFSDTDVGDTHAASEWEVDESGGDFSAPAADSGEDAVNLTSITLTGLSPSTAYIARVRHKDDSADAGTEWSSWSTSASFTTDAAPVGGGFAARIAGGIVR